MNRLHWSPRSPYVRKVMVALHEKGIADQVETVRTLADPIFPPESFFPVNPLAKIPTLEREGEPVLVDSRVIIEWADQQAGGAVTLLPSDPEVRLVALRDDAIGTGLIDIAMTRLIEAVLRPDDKRDERIIATCRKKANAVLDWLEAHVPNLEARPFDAGHLAIGVALCYLDFRFAADQWREGRPALAAWHQGFSERPSVIATAFRDDPRPAS